MHAFILHTRQVCVYVLAHQPSLHPSQKFPGTFAGNPMPSGCRSAVSVYAPTRHATTTMTRLNRRWRQAPQQERNDRTNAPTQIRTGECQARDQSLAQEIGTWRTDLPLDTGNNRPRLPPLRHSCDSDKRFRRHSRYTLTDIHTCTHNDSISPMVSTDTNRP